MVSFNPRRPGASGSGGGAPIFGWLGRDANAASLLATAQRHLQIRSDVVAALPAAMRSGFEVLKIDGGTLTLSVSSAAYAAKFRQMAPRVLSHIQGAGWNVSEIRLRVKGPTGFDDPVRPPKEARALDERDLKAFEALGAQLKPGPLADAVARLLAHHRGENEQIRRASIPGETPGGPRPGKNT